LEESRKIKHDEINESETPIGFRLEFKRVVPAAFINTTLEQICKQPVQNRKEIFINVVEHLQYHDILGGNSIFNFYGWVEQQNLL